MLCKYESQLSSPREYRNSAQLLTTQPKHLHKELSVTVKDELQQKVITLHPGCVSHCWINQILPVKITKIYKNKKYNALKSKVW